MLALRQRVLDGEATHPLSRRPTRRPHSIEYRPFSITAPPGGAAHVGEAIAARCASAAARRRQLRSSARYRESPAIGNSASPFWHGSRLHRAPSSSASRNRRPAALDPISRSGQRLADGDQLQRSFTSRYDGSRSLFFEGTSLTAALPARRCRRRQRPTHGIVTAGQFGPLPLAGDRSVDFPTDNRHIHRLR